MEDIELANLARQAAGILGVTPADILSGAVNVVSGWFGWNDCAAHNNRKYRAIIDLTLASRDWTTARQWLNAGRVAGATGKCNEGAIRYLAQRLSQLLAAGQVVEPPTAQEAATGCVVPDVVARYLQAVQAAGGPPAGFGRARWCAGSPAQRAEWLDGANRGAGLLELRMLQRRAQQQAPEAPASGGSSGALLLATLAAAAVLFINRRGGKR